MKKNIWIGFAAIFLLTSCNNDKKLLDSLSDYNNSMEGKGYHFGDKLNLPEVVADNAENITISFGDKETSSLNGIAFKGENMLVTGKNWSKIYEVVFK